MAESFDLQVSETDTGFWPPCVPYLHALNTPGVELFHEAHGRFHPLHAYKSSIGRVGAAFGLAINALDQLRASGQLAHDLAGELLERHRALYYAMSEHFEACEKAVSGLVPPDPAGETSFSETILEEAPHLSARGSCDQ